LFWANLVTWGSLIDNKSTVGKVWLRVNAFVATPGFYARRDFLLVSLMPTGQHASFEWQELWQPSKLKDDPNFLRLGTFVVSQNMRRVSSFLPVSPFSLDYSPSLCFCFSSLRSGWRWRPHHFGTRIACFAFGICSICIKTWMQPCLVLSMLYYVRLRSPVACEGDATT